jgi:DNA-binding Lrp family transcriptional regulator
LRAYVLIQTNREMEDLSRELRAIPGVVSAEDVTGAYDAIAVARSDSVRYLNEVVLPEIRRLPGVVRALPAPLLDSRGDRELEPSGAGSAAGERAA